MGGKNRNIVFSIFLILLLFVYSYPFIKSGFPHGNDIFYHFSRIQGSAELLKSEHFDFSILPGFFFDYGYAVGLFYPLGLLFIPIVLIYVGLNFITAYKILIVLVTAFTLFGMFYTTHKLFKNRWLALVSSTFYVFSVYRNYSDLYERAAVGEFIAFTFLPWIFYGVHILVHDRSKRWMILCFGWLVSY